MRFKIDKSKSAITSVNRGGIRVLPDIDGVFDTDLYRDNISVDMGSLAQTDGKYASYISAEQVESAKKEIEELVSFWVSKGIAEIIEEPKAKK